MVVQNFNEGRCVATAPGYRMRETEAMHQTEQRIRLVNGPCKEDRFFSGGLAACPTQSLQQLDHLQFTNVR